MAEVVVPVVLLVLQVAPSAGAAVQYSGALPVGVAFKSGDVIHGGAGSIPGTVKRDDSPVDVPLRRRVRLHREIDGMPVREVWSDGATGAYLFVDIDPAYRYTVIAYDHAHEYRAEVADNITPDVMP